MKHPKDTLNGIVMPKKQWQLVLDCLKELLEVVLAGEPLAAPTEGICRNWYITMIQTGVPSATAYQAFEIVTAVGMRWKHSKSPGLVDPFPVPRIPIDGSNSARFYWTGANRDLRIDLMRYTIKRMRDKIRRMK